MPASSRHPVVDAFDSAAIVLKAIGSASFASPSVFRIPQSPSSFPALCRLRIFTSCIVVKDKLSATGMRNASLPLLPVDRA
jgi:hypothetical protein